MQLDLFEAMKDVVSITIVYLNDDLSVKTKTVGVHKNIVISRKCSFNEKELVNVCKKAKTIERRRYGYDVIYQDDEALKSVFVRFINFVTSESMTVFEYIQSYFEIAADFERSYTK